MTHFQQNNMKIKNKSLFLFLFLCLTYSFKGLLPNYKLISGIQIVIILLSISVFYKYLKSKIDIFLSNVQKKIIILLILILLVVYHSLYVYIS